MAPDIRSRVRIPAPDEGMWSSKTWVPVDCSTNSSPSTTAGLLTGLPIIMFLLVGKVEYIKKFKRDVLPETLKI
jgi:hypothetical protein